MGPKANKVSVKSVSKVKAKETKPNVVAKKKQTKAKEVKPNVVAKTPKKQTKSVIVSPPKDLCGLCAKKEIGDLSCSKCNRKLCKTCVQQKGCELCTIDKTFYCKYCFLNFCYKTRLGWVCQSHDAY